MTKVGIIANPVSARGIRRIVSHAGNLPINDRANIVLRMLTGLMAPIAPGLIEEVGIGGVEKVLPDTVYLPSVSAGSFALDGERELTFSETCDVSIRLQTDAFRTVNVPDCMAYAARHGLLTRAASEALHSAQPKGRIT
ncbi:hypothetical protein [Frigidibacter sp. SD6-1]|uniref:hypothetical protein n=1 Tax=Frigidibacter sp. SD6-1 TaxID=3032581 RepID=UPI0024E0315B|nr:hypothetical protein [Frigidibacter sp. SD6-1]